MYLGTQFVTFLDCNVDSETAASVYTKIFEYNADII